MLKVLHCAKLLLNGDANLTRDACAELLPIRSVSSEDMRSIEPGVGSWGFTTEFLQVQAGLRDDRPEVQKTLAFGLLM